MNLLRLRSIAVKEILQMVRDPRLLGLLVAVPAIQLFFFGYAVSTDLKGVRLGVVMQDASPEARRLVEAIQATGAFRFREASDSPGDAPRWLADGDADVVLHIPPDFSAVLEKGEAPVVQVLSDGSDSNTATLAFQYLSGAARSWAGQYRGEHLERHPEAAVRFASVPQVALEPRFWYNPDLKSVHFQVPGVLVIVLLAIVISQSSLSVVKERELGNLEQITVTPIRGAELLVGKTIPVAGIGLGMTLVITFIAWAWFGVPFRGSLLFLLACSMLYLLSIMGIGLYISVVSRTQLEAQLTANLLISPLIILSGFLFPISNMPLVAQWLSYLVPTRYFIQVVRGVFLKGQGLAELWQPAVALAVLGVLLYLIGTLSYRKQAD